MNKGVSVVEESGGSGGTEKEVEVEAGGVFWINGMDKGHCGDIQCNGHCNDGFQQPRRRVRADDSWRTPSQRSEVTTVQNRYQPLQEEDTVEDIEKPKTTQVGNMWKENWPKRTLKGDTAVNGKITIDSGAADSVMPKHEAGQLFSFLPRKEGVKFVAANGQIIENYGRRNIAFKTEGHEGVNCMTFHVTDVKKTLASVSKMVEKGNEVHFTPKGSYIQGWNGERIPLKVENGVYVMDIEYLTGFNGQV